MKKLILLIIVSFVFSFISYSQINLPELTQQKLDNYSVNEYPEKIYIQTDKSFYTLDEDIWFSAYLVNGITHYRSPKSRIVYVELISPQKKVISSRTLYINDLSAAGDFKIDNDWVEGNYTLRGYTNYMRNFSPELFFQKEIPIYKINKKSETSKKGNKKTLSKNSLKNTVLETEISFYPEGGYLVEGIQTKVAFEVKTHTNSEVKITGTLRDQDNNVITEISTVDLGLGLFTFIPEAGKIYHVNINEQEKKYVLPKPLPNGYILNTLNTKKYIIVTINSNTNNGLADTYLVAHQRGLLFYENYETKFVNSNTIKIPISYLSDGVVNVTLFNKDGHPVAERNIFVDNPNNNLKLSINTDKQNYQSRKKVNVSVDLTNVDGIKENSTLSMAVRNLEAFPYNTRTNNIKTYLLLNSDLRGDVKNPGYFFEKENDPKRKYLLDLVMMTNGWKRFTWQELLKTQKTNQEYQPESGIYISGKITKIKKPDVPHTKGEIRLTFLGNIFAQEPIQYPDSLGRFKFGPYTFMDSIPSRIEARYDNFNSQSLKSKKVLVHLDKNKSIPAIQENTNIDEITMAKKDSNFVKISQYIQDVKFKYNKEIEELEAVELSIKKKTDAEKRKKDMQNRTMYRRPDNMNNRIDLTNLDYTATTVMDVLTGNSVIGVNDTSDGLIWYRNRNPVYIFLDGRQIDFNILQTVTSDEISFLDILTGSGTNVFVGINSNSSSAILALYSKKRGEKRNVTVKRKPSVINFKAGGFYTAREFYSPDHINGIEEVNRTDVRTTLHWEPVIKTSQKKQSNVTFFTSDLKSEYIIEIEGMSDKGQPIHAIKTFNVE